MSSTIMFNYIKKILKARLSSGYMSFFSGFCQFQKRIENKTSWFSCLKDKYSMYTFSIPCIFKGRFKNTQHRIQQRWLSLIA